MPGRSIGESAAAARRDRRRLREARSRRHVVVDGSTLPLVWVMAIRRATRMPARSSSRPARPSAAGTIEPMIRQTVARVDLAALKRNYAHIVEHLAAHSAVRAPGVIAVVKANAYGHGAGQVARALEDAGADLLACADIEEGSALRAAGVKADILVFGALSVSDLDGLFDCRLTPTISTPGAAHAVQAAAEKYKQTLRYHLKLDTGMNRLGFRWDNVRRTLPELLASPNLELAAVYTHFATADDPESALFGEQRKRFESALKGIDDIQRGTRGNRREDQH